MHGSRPSCVREVCWWSSMCIQVPVQHWLQGREGRPSFSASCTHDLWHSACFTMLLPLVCATPLSAPRRTLSRSDSVGPGCEDSLWGSNAMGVPIQALLLLMRGKGGARQRPGVACLKWGLVAGVGRLFGVGFGSVCKHGCMFQPLLCCMQICRTNLRQDIFCLRCCR